MSGTFNKTARDLAQALKTISAQSTSPYDTQAEVRRIENNIAWVHILGGVDETPVQLTMNAKKGDIVQVRVSGGQAWLYGNATSPPTDDTKAIKAEKRAMVADEHAVSAVTSAMLAQQAADEAIADAYDAATAANIANEKAIAATADAERAERKADAADISARLAKESAETASNAARNAYYSSSLALDQLSVVENVVGVLELVSKNGEYRRTQDLEPAANKWYFLRIGNTEPYEYQVQNNVTFEYILTSDTDIIQGKPYYTRNGSGTEQDPYTYTEVSSPVVGDLNTYYENTRWYYFELIGIDNAITNYVSSHLAISGNSLYLQNNNTRIELSTTNGMILYNESGNPIAKYGTGAIIGNENGFHVSITNDRLSFFRDSTNEVAYISGDKLYITQSVVLQQMDVGRFTGEVDPVTGQIGKGLWSWKVHDINGRNNLYLKWLG